MLVICLEVNTDRETKSALVNYLQNLKRRHVFGDSTIIWYHGDTVSGCDGRLVALESGETKRL
jgi:hypothetical protein